jgi:hypothetical protein
MVGDPLRCITIFIIPVHFCQPDVTKCSAFHRKRKIFDGAPTGNRSTDRSEALTYKESAK